MTETVDMSEDSERAVEIRNALTDKLRADGMITSEVVERAFRTVPRHLFVPAGTSLEVAYNADDSVATKTDEHGVIISSVSAPFIQARMIEQARLGPGMSVLEIGSGGYNAALLAEVVGPTGRVVSVDIDPEVTERARALLESTGYGDAVTVVLGDAEQGVPEAGPFDAIIVTVGAWDIPPAWLRQLGDSGTLVAPLLMNGISRSIAFRREADHLVSTSAEVCGFVAMQGEGEHAERVFLLPDAHGRAVKLRFDDGAPDDPSLLDGVLATERTEVWSGVTIKSGVSFADLHLWFAGFLPGFCKLAVDEGTDLADERGSWFPFGVVRGDSFAYLAVRRALEGAGVEFGARAYGMHGIQAATAMVEQIQAWDRQARGGPAPTFAFWPSGSDHTHLPPGTAVFPKTHGLATTSWPALG
ncbi:methyltransferase, FxLD system [Sphaerimonospora cavernae]|uniref:Protein-L-isoaspartate O-methyltransferase n=1 Tax=Sphaerimonospora cavernae TaxID=1740611 RepID=A0ABV6U124_9ACTN